MNITGNALKLIDAQDRISDWRNRMKDLLGIPPEETPQSVFIPIEDLRNIIEGFAALEAEYTVTGARLYLTFSGADSNYISGILVPTGHAADQPIFGPHDDIIVDVQTGSKDHIGPDTHISAYDFTRPCPPLGDCTGASAYFKAD